MSAYLTHNYEVIFTHMKRDITCVIKFLKPIYDLSKAYDNLQSRAVSKLVSK